MLHITSHKLMFDSNHPRTKLGGNIDAQLLPRELDELNGNMHEFIYNALFSLGHCQKKITKKLCW